ncbi:hypothetical protein D3C78_1121570 [compost metagenome]
MGDLQALTFGSKQHGVITDHIAGTHGGEADGLAITRTGLAFTAIHRHFLQVAAQRIGNHFTHAQRSTRRRIDLVPVVSLDDLDIDIITQHPRSHVQQLQAEVDANAEVGGEDDRNVLARFGQQLLFFGRETGGADDHRLACLAAERQVLQGHRGMSEVDQHVELVGDLGQVVGQQHADPAQRRQLTCISADQRAVGAIDRRGQPGTRGLLHCFDQGLAHAPCRAHYRYTSHALFLLTSRRRSASRLRTSHWLSANGNCRLPANHAALRAARADDG